MLVPINRSALLTTGGEAEVLVNTTLEAQLMMCIFASTNDLHGRPTDAFATEHLKHRPD
jgi:hypothetical protein